MKNLFFAALFFLSIQAAKATSCASGGVYLDRKNDTISGQQIFLFNAYGNREYLLLKLAYKEAQLVLKSEEHEVALVMIDFNKSAYQESQIIMKPALELTVGRKYTLIAKGALKPDEIKWFGGEFFIKAGLDTISPRWIAEPKISFNGHSLRGNFNAGVYKAKMKFNEEDVIVRVKLVAASEPEYNQRFAFLSREILYLGKGECYGNFTLIRGKEYIAEFTPVDASGNTGESRTIRFTV